MRGLVVGKGVIKRRFDSPTNSRSAVNRNGVSQVELEQSQVVKAHHVIRVLVRVDHGVDDSDSLAKQLLTQIG